MCQREVDQHIWTPLFKHPHTFLMGENVLGCLNKGHVALVSVYLSPSRGSYLQQIPIMMISWTSSWTMQTDKYLGIQLVERNLFRWTAQTNSEDNWQRDHWQIHRWMASEEINVFLRLRLFKGSTSSCRQQQPEVRKLESHKKDAELSLWI